MKKNLMVVVLFLFSNVLFAFDKVKGGYKSCKVIVYFPKLGKIDLNSKKWNNNIKFDKKGNEISFKTIYKYDNSGNKIEEVSYSNVNSFWVITEYIYSK